MAGLWPHHTCVQDGTAKMSKSAENDLSRINLTDTADAISNKVCASCCS